MASSFLSNLSTMPWSASAVLVQPMRGFCHVRGASKRISQWRVLYVPLCIWWRAGMKMCALRPTVKSPVPDTSDTSFGCEISDSPTVGLAASVAW